VETRHVRGGGGERVVRPSVACGAAPWRRHAGDRMGRGWWRRGGAPIEPRRHARTHHAGGAWELTQLSGSARRA
jgi:hypothetical protein